MQRRNTGSMKGANIAAPALRGCSIIPGCAAFPSNPWHISVGLLPPCGVRRAVTIVIDVIQC
ncbi:hypothetical protein AZA_58623 [Nitrospirillum viridazoti Y2]|nr:hypothetical protein AZA_58623 [Nitrospirillum amazonense Y2]